jgi:hypothetical protein
MATKQQPAISPSKVRYIKLGEGGSWEKECLSKGIVRFGFGSATPQRFPLCGGKKWDELKKTFLAEPRMSKGTATRFTNETRIFFEDDGTTLWLTFVGEQLCWGFLTADAPKRHADGDGVWRTVAGGWQRADLNGEQLTKDRLSGSLTKLAAYRGTSCQVDVADYVIRRINGKKTLQVERALKAIREMRSSALEMMKLLGDKDFETLVDLIFTYSGWRRLGPVGRTQKTLDLDLMLPSTGERAFVQVKSKTTSAELAKYADHLEEHGPFDRMFYAFHSGDAKTDDERVTVLGPEKLAELAVEAGLADWLIRKVE